MLGHHHHAYTIRTPSPTRVRLGPFPKFVQQQRQRPAQQKDKDEVVVTISSSRSPSPTRHHHQDWQRKQRLSVNIYQDDEPQPRPPRIPDRHYASQTMQHHLQDQRRQSQYRHSHLYCRTCPSPRLRGATSRKEEEEKEEEEPVTLEDLVEAAFQACERARQLAPYGPEAVGAALLCSNGDVFLGCSVGEDSGCSSVSAERAILRKALREGHCPPFQALVLAMDAMQNPSAFPVPDKECFRHFGFLPIFLVNKNLDIHSTTSSGATRQATSSPPPLLPPRRRVVVQDILPPAPKHPSSPLSAPRRVPCQSRSPLRRPPVPPVSSSQSSPRRVPGGPHSWTGPQVLDWLVHVVKLPQYVQDFANARVDGHKLLHIYSHEKATAGRASTQSKAYHRTHHYHAFSHSSSALEDTLHVYQPAHKKRLLAEIQKLKYGECIPNVPKKAALRPVQRRLELTRREVVAADDDCQHEDEEDEDDISTLQRRERSVKKAAAAAAAKKNYGQDASRHSNPLKQLSRIKKVFDDCLTAVALGVDGKALLLDGEQTLVGLRTLGCVASQESVREYFLRRSISLKRRDVSFYEFLRATLACGGGIAGGWAKALPLQSTTPTKSPAAIVKKLKPNKKEKLKRAEVAASPALPPPPPPRVSSSSYSSSSYSSSSSSSSSCSPSQCSVSSLSGAEEEEESHVAKQTQVSPIIPTPPSAQSPSSPSPVIPPVTALLQTVLSPHKLSNLVVPATTIAPSPALKRSLGPLPLPIAPTSTETSSSISPASPQQQQVQLPVPAAVRKATLIPPLSIATAPPATITAGKPEQYEEASDQSPTQREETPSAVRFLSPSPPSPGGQRSQPPSPPSTLPHEQQNVYRPSHRRLSSSSSSSYSQSSYSSPLPVAQALLQRPSPPSIASLSTSTSVSSTEQQRQTQQPKPGNLARCSSDQSESVIASIISDEDVSEPPNPVIASSSLPRRDSSSSSSFSSSINSSSPAPASPPLLDVGATIEARYKGRDRWFSGTVARVHEQERAYDIHYDDDDVETHVPSDLVRARGNNTALQPSSPLSTSLSSSKTLIFQKGDRVEARYRGRETFYSGVIGAVHTQDGAYDIHYDDGDVEERVAAALVRAVGGQR